MKINSTGKQIQNLAGTLCGVGMFLFTAGGIAFFLQDHVFAGIIFIAVGCYATWACTRILQGFGELIEETTANRANTDRILFVLESQCRHERETESPNVTEE